MEKTLHAGPWAGEFGWELCSWNPIVRKTAHEYDKVIVEGPARSEYLYEFASEYRVREIQHGTSDEYNGKCEGVFKLEFGATHLKPHQGRMGRPEKRMFRSASGRPDLRKEWRCLAPEPEFVADVLCSFRGAKNYRGRIIEDKEYPVERCTELVRVLIEEENLTVACIGLRDNYHVEGAVDLRGVPLEKQCAALAGGKICVGPSSGPMHLASLCKVPHVVWYNRADKSTSISRYTNHWNPFDTPFTYMKQELPSVLEIVEEIKKYIS